MTIADLIARWTGTEGGAERANYQMFLSEFAQALALPAPQPKGAGLGDYEFEAPVRSEAALGRKGTGRIDLYKRDCFILEAKQSQLKPGEVAPVDPVEPPPASITDLFGHVIGMEAPARPVARYDRLMADARLQAERYALALPGDHRAPPFLIVADIGRAFELYFDWAGNGRGYAPFPDERQYRVGLKQLADDTLLPGVDLSAADLLRAIWTAPAGVDPRLKAAEVTRDIARRLSRVAEQLERDERNRHPGAIEIALGIEATSLFLMRMLFCMFAEDVGLLPKDSFKSFLEEAQRKSVHFWRNGLSDLWSRMNDAQEVNRYWPYGDAIIRYFNGNLFGGTRIFDLPDEFKNELLVAAAKDWRKVEPAIFGTLLEQVLTSADRAKLGAHYTPRAYVDRLVEATIMDVLRPEWDATLERARVLADSGDRDGAVAVARAFHARLGELRVLDPACGTGNFLYVAMEQLLRLEGEVRQFVAGLDAAFVPTVHPNQFLGLELNPRAAVIAELVLWIGWLRYRLANTPEAIGEPVLPTLTNINFGTHGGYDAVLVRLPTGDPDTANPRRPAWPEADFIIGNPPFIGAKFLRERLGANYAEALWAANPRVAKSADFVMQWWDRAADILTRPGTRLRRFGLVTTNSITQVFSRRVIEHWLSIPVPVPVTDDGDGPERRASGDPGGDSCPAPSVDSHGPIPRSGEDRAGGLHLVLAVPDHPWTRVTKDAAAVRIAMTVADAGAGTGRLVTIVRERAIDTDAPVLDVAVDHGAINADLSTGTDVTRVVPLRANEGLGSRGVQLMGAGFMVTAAQAKSLGLGTRPGLDAHIREYRNGRDLLQRPRGVFVIDLFGLDEVTVMDRFPEVYDHLLKNVRNSTDEKGRPNGRAVNNRASYRDHWWIFGEPRRELRPAIAGIARYIATTETSKHRIFQFINSSVLADNMIVVVAADDPTLFGVLSGRFHQEWVLHSGGWLGFGNDNRYSKSLVFDPFPFPDATGAQRDTIAGIAERLDATRRTALGENPSLTMTGLYNLVAAIRDGTLSPQDESAAVRARARIVAKLHDDLDDAVADAYGWPRDLPAAQVVARLVALNAERAAEEAAGHVRWLRPDYQVPRFAVPPVVAGRRKARRSPAVVPGGGTA
ncbi:hypothetical protein ASG29_05725 [Sphingomonas sp. Leaf412]|uniref:DNA methyltransferase n=1 Tax=Sphingomonas sp. Leaf412 TaxID=1736370 RepID=UPI0006FB522D|nr:DNA methyltransferase [Sphingomonas sp. Leaf412]KQT33538.1 hypothetical protein ASG29_05725 [Sphingomonas sp. Leaf412]